VEAEPLQVNLQNVAVEGLISGTQVRELPLNNRNYEQLVTLQPGVTSNTADQVYVGTTNPQGAVNIVSFSISGNRQSQNNWTIDGADNVDHGSNITLLVYPSVDAIAEFKVERSNYSPEFGRSASGQINVVTRSGTSTFHGGLYEFFRNDVFNANSFINNRVGNPRPVLRYNDFGGTIGGPFFIPNFYNQNKEKTFFFFSEEVRRVTTTGRSNLYCPDGSGEAGFFSISCLHGSLGNRSMHCNRHADSLHEFRPGRRGLLEGCVREHADTARFRGGPVFQLSRRVQLPRRTLARGPCCK